MGSYKHVVVTTIEVKKGDTEAMPAYRDRVTFHTFDFNGDKAVFLKDIEWVEEGKDTEEYKFTATYISPEYAKECILEELGTNAEDVPLLYCIHGFNVEPSSCLEKMKKRAMARLKRMKVPYYSFPVLWPCSDEGSSNETDSEWERYVVDQDGKTIDGERVRPAMNVGRNFRYLVNSIENNDLFPNKSLLAHSMVNQ